MRRDERPYFELVTGGAPRKLHLLQSSVSGAIMQGVLGEGRTPVIALLPMQQDAARSGRRDVEHRCAGRHCNSTKNKPKGLLHSLHLHPQIQLWPAIPRSLFSLLHRNGYFYCTDNLNVTFRPLFSPRKNCTNAFPYVPIHIHLFLCMEKITCSKNFYIKENAQ